MNIEVINGEGEFRVFDIDYNGEQLDIFRTHLGLCGIIIRMTFKVGNISCWRFTIEQMSKLDISQIFAK